MILDGLGLSKIPATGVEPVFSEGRRIHDSRNHLIAKEVIGNDPYQPAHALIIPTQRSTQQGDHEQILAYLPNDVVSVTR